MKQAIHRPFRHLQLRALWSIATALIIALLPLHGEDKNLNTNSPFLPPGHGEKKPAPSKPKPVTNGPISREVEFRGLIELNGVYKFSLFSKNDQKGYWIRENQTVEGLRVQSFDPNAMSIVVDKDGRSERITLVSATDSPLPVSVAKSPNNNQQPPQNTAAQRNANRPNQNNENKRQVVPRRRVILPKK